MASSTAQDENVLVERVFLRIGSAETDDQLETTLSKFLAPVLLKLNSSDEVIRKKVMELLVHVNKRLKSRSRIQLPVEALLSLFQDKEATPFVTNFTILYIKMGYPRMDFEKQAELIPLLMSCLESRPANHQDLLMQLMIPALQHVKMPRTVEERRQKFQLGDKPVTRQLLLDYMMDLLLLPYSYHNVAPSGEGPPPPTPAPPPGVSEKALKRVLGESPLTPENLEKAKMGVLNFLGSEIFSESEVVCHYVIGSSDTRHSVATSADMELKKITGSVDWNSTEILTKLFSIFQGTVAVKGQPQIKAEERRSPVCTRIRLKIFPFFLRAREAVNMFPSCIQVVFDCLFGANPNAKLRSMAVQFVHHMCLNCEETKFAMFDAVLLSGMVKVIGEAKEDPKLRSLAYVAVGKIARRSPHRVAKDIALIQRFFEAMCQEDTETRLAVQEALSMMSSSFRQIDETNLQLLEALLMQNIDKVEPQARVVAAQYAAAVFPANHVPSRYILMLGAGDVKDDIRLESVKALRGVASTEDPTEKSQRKNGDRLPDFVSMISFIKEKAALREKSQHKYVVGNVVMPFNPLTYTEIVLYLRMCLAQDAGQPPTPQLSELQDQAPAVASFLSSLLSQHPTDTGPVQSYVAMLRQLLTAISGQEAMYCLLEVVAMAPKQLAPYFLKHLDWLKGFISSPKDEIKQYAAEMFAIVTVATSGTEDIIAAVKELMANLKDKNTEVQQGTILTLGHLLGQWCRPGCHGDLQVEDMEHDGEMTDQGDRLKDRETALLSCVKMLYPFLNSENAGLKGAVCIALGEIAKSTALPLPSGEEEDSAEEITKLSLLKKLIGMVKTAKETNKTKERAALCLGCLCVGEADFPHRKKAMEELFTAVQSKQVELQFSIALALSWAAQGRKAPVARDAWSQTEADFEVKMSGFPDEVEWYLAQLLQTYVCHVNPHLRQASCIWLLTLVKQCSQHKAVQSRLLDIQRGFIRLLSDTDEVTQDIASKGLGHGYEICTPEQKDLLVSELVDTLLTGKRAKQTVSEDTKLFEDESLGKTPDGGGLSTYKELCAIANDLNQPDLIYKFMHLANHNATWNTRKGAAFGFSTIATQAGEQLAPYMGQIVPRLYRYQFDPNPRIQQAMAGIWNALVKDNKKTVDLYLKEILSDLLKNLTSNQWRVRESSCNAVTDLLRGRVLDSVVDDLPELWEQCLRVRDDIKESVRTAADQSCKTLSKVSIRICDPENGQAGGRATRAVLPCLLNITLNTNVKEVRAIGLSTILEISKKAGELLKPHIPALVVALLEAVSGLEPQVLNYLSFHTSSQATQDKLDKARIAASKSSPMMETVNRCVQYVDESVLTELVPRLTDLVKRSIGVGTKAACSSFVVSLVLHCPQDLAPHAGKLMGAFLQGLNDRNSSVRKNYATALAHLVKVGKDSSTEKLITKLKTWYLDHENESAQQACGVTLHAISQTAPDHLRRHASLAMPLAFFALHQEKTEEEKKSNESTEWEDVWNEITPGMEGGIRLYLSEITAMLVELIDASAWTTKAQAARAMATVAERLGAQLGSPHLGQMLDALLGALLSRTWTGKEALLNTLSTICLSCKDAVLQDDTLVQKIVDTALRESGKDQPVYRLSALACLGSIVETFQRDLFQRVWDIVTPHLSQTKKEKDDDSSPVQEEELTKVCYVTLGQAWPLAHTTQGEFKEVYLDKLVSALPVSTWKVQMVVLQALYKYIDRLKEFEKERLSAEPNQFSSTMHTVFSAVLPCLGNLKYAAIRTESASIIRLIVSRLAEVNQLGTISPSVRQQLTQALTPLTSDGPYELREVCSQLVKTVTSIS
ncbi:proteasome adapter and scaffold protein ECM29-like isoform X2 [Babylonia areolata]|uniref:proteasome adapter and scaffold protein ECM29-like isoform X2 n=1 Tax=Babylonia areolata TaxID=304850 RepID=UPI003FD654B8